MSNNHCHRVTTQLQLINIVVVVVIIVIIIIIIIIIIIREKSPLVQGLMSKEAQGQALSHVLLQNHESDWTNAQEHCHDGATVFFPPPQNRPFSPRCHAQPFHHSQIIFLVHCLVMR
jgi:hypothetical protein